MNAASQVCLAVLPLLLSCGPADPFGYKPLPGGETGDPGRDSADTGAPLPYGPAIYPTGQIQSPLTPYVVDHMAAVRDQGVGWHDDVFMKVGDSMTADANALFCFADSGVDLGEYGELQSTLDYFLAGDAAGDTPFDRESLAAEVGMSATWAISDDPSPLEQEMDAIGPHWAVAQYGTNDMQLGTSYQSAIWGFGSNMMDLLDAMVDEGVVPTLLTIPPREDVADACLWVPSYNAVIRGVAQAWQVPLVDLHLAMQSVSGYGLGSDHLHLNAYSGGACVLSEAGLDYGNNMRNRVILEALDRLRAVMLEGEPALDPAEDLQQGDGSPADPFIIADLPFTHWMDTRESPNSALDVYTGCDAEQDESGPEYLYKLELDTSRPLRFMVFDRGDVDIDLHLLDESASVGGCIARNDKIIETTLGAATYHLAMDSYVSSGGQVRSGSYLLVVLECESGDPDCS